MAVVMEAYVNGVSTRKVDRLVEQLGIHGMSKDRVSALCRALDDQVAVFRQRPLEGAHPYLWLDAKVVKVRDRGHVYPKALVIAYSVHETGLREVIGLDIGEIETEAFWVAFLRSLRERGLAGVRLCVSDEHLGLKHAIARVLGVPVAALHGPFRPRHAASLPARRSAGWSPRRSGRSSTPTATRPPRDRCGEVIERLRGPGAEGRRAARGAEEDLLAFYRFPAGALVQAALHQPVGAREPRDRPARGRRRDLPQRRQRDPARRRAADRAERRMARQPPLPLRGIPRARPRRPDIDEEVVRSAVHRRLKPGARGSRAGAREKLFKTLRVSNSNSNYYDNTDERYTTSYDLTSGVGDIIVTVFSTERSPT